MNKKRVLLIAFLTLALAASLGALAACGGGGSSASSSEGKPSAGSDQAVALKTSPFYVLVIGDDTRKGTVDLDGQYADGKGRADTAMLIRVDPTNYTFDLITIPRDTQASYDGDVCKINQVYERGGIEAYKQAVKELTGVDPDYYMITTFVGFEDIIDKMGGIDVTVTVDESMKDIVSGEMVEFPAGDQKLNGKEALVFARDRHGYEDYVGNQEEAVRQIHDRYIMATIIQSILSLGPEKAVELAKSLYPFVTTDMSEAELLAYVKDFAEHASQVKFVNNCSGPYEGDMDEESGLWLAYRDEATWKKVIEAVESGKDATKIVELPAVDFGARATDEGASDKSADTEGEGGEGGEAEGGEGEEA